MTPIIDMVTFKQQLYRETKRRIVSTPEFVTTEIVQRAQAMGYDLAYALLPLLVPPSPDHSILVSGNAGQPLHIHQTWKENRANIYRKCLALKAQLCHSEESLRFVWPTTGMLFQRWWMKTEHNNGPAKNVKCHVAVALLPALVSDEKVFPVKEGQGSLEYCLVRRNEWVYSRAVVILNDAESGYH